MPNKPRIRLKDFVGEIIILLLSIILVIITVISVNKVEKENIELREAVAEYQVSEDWFDDYLDVMEAIYESKMNEAVLEERIKWLERTETINPQQMYDDFELVIGELDAYSGVDFSFYFENKYPEVYARIEQYDELFG